MNSPISTENTPSPHIVIGTIDASRRRYSRTKISICLTLVLLLIGPWFLMGNLLVIPSDVKASRTQFSELMASYSQKKEQWHNAKEQLLEKMQAVPLEEQMGFESAHFDDIPLEVLMALLVENFHFSPEKNGSVSVYPGDCPQTYRCLLSKYEQGIWPLKILLSLDISLTTQQGQIAVDSYRLRRGNREISQDFASLYFGPELKLLRQIEPLASRLSQIHLYTPTQSITEGSSIRLGWKYHPTPPM